MEFHPQKCQVITITKKIRPIVNKYTIHNEELLETKCAKYLGVNIDSKLNWNSQINLTCRKAYSSLAFIKRNLSHAPKSTKEQCVKALVKPILEYGCCVWDPHTRKQKDELEKVQKNAARFITNSYEYTPGSTKINMQKLNWIPLEEQRARIKSTIFYKGINKLIDIPIKECQLNSHNINTRQNNENTYCIPKSKLDCHLYSYFPSSIRLWNSIPITIKCSPTVDTFKQSLDKIILKAKY